ncbi:ribonuclease H [Malassezia sp. CBS 17886]|nr:ribonuclease H [Malassezia sp. CBS 17886]
MKYYAVRMGRSPGIYETWDDCRAQVSGFPGCVYKSFPSRGDAQAFVAGRPARVPDAKGTPRDTEAARAPPVAVFPPSRKGQLRVYTDGSSIGNGRKGARAGYGVFWEDPALHHLNKAARVPGAEQTNNRGELLAILHALDVCPDANAPLAIYTDSQYAVNGAART